MKLMAFDPGGTTGVAEYNTTSRKWFRYELKGEHHQELNERLNSVGPDIVIYERFVYQRREIDKGVSLSLASVEYIGVIKRWWQFWHDEDPDGPLLVVQTPAQAKNFWTDARLKKLDLWDSSPHVRDATRHMLYYLAMTLEDKSWFDKLR